MGGHAAGEVASALALETLERAVGERRGLAEAFRLANERVHQAASEPGRRGMGTTLVAVLVDGPQFWVANVGDSRAYLVSAQGIRRMTEDHSFLAEAMKQGQSEEEAMATPWRDALTRSIGTEADVEVDVLGPLRLEDDSAFLICSDGLYKLLSDGAIRDLFQRSNGVRGAAESLVAAAFDAGSDDNISVAIAEYGEVPRSTGPRAAGGSHDREPSEAWEKEEAGVGGVAPMAGSPEGAGAFAGLPVAAVAAVVVLLSALLAIVVFGS
jgi:protein phosphatase